MPNDVGRLHAIFFFGINPMGVNEFVCECYMVFASYNNTILFKLCIVEVLMQMAFFFIHKMYITFPRNKRRYSEGLHHR